MINKIVPIAKFSKLGKKFSFLENTSVVLNKKNIPVGFVFGRDAFISLLEKIDGEFESKVGDGKKAFDNPAGKLIDMIEEKLPVNSEFVSDLKSAIISAKKQGWITFDEIRQALNV